MNEISKKTQYILRRKILNLSLSKREGGRTVGSGVVKNIIE